MYKGFLVDKKLLADDPHVSQGCVACHKGNEKSGTKDGAHKGMTSRPSDNPSVCATCHDQIAKNYGKSLHYTTAGLRTGVSGRFSEAEKKLFTEKVFEKSCRSCHASCGDCHVKIPATTGVNPGLIKGHAFVKRDEGKTCAICHGGRVYPEYTGDYGGSPDVHYQKGMLCMDCHKVTGMHGNGAAYASKQEVKDKPACAACHKAGQEKSEKARTSHATHKDRVSCQACHSSTPYRNCYDCHMGAGAQSKPGFFLGLNLRNKGQITTLRLIPVVRDTFKSVGIGMAQFDSLPNYWNTSPHNIRKRTE